HRGQDPFVRDTGSFRVPAPRTRPQTPGRHTPRLGRANLAAWALSAPCRGRGAHHVRRGRHLRGPGTYRTTPAARLRGRPGRGDLRLSGTTPDERGDPAHAVASRPVLLPLRGGRSRHLPGRGDPPGAPWRQLADRAHGRVPDRD